MTAVAGRSLHRIASMSLLESCLVASMATKAKGRIIGFKEIGFIRAMGEMAGVTTFLLQYLVYHFLLKIFLFMALVAKFTAFCLEKISGRRCMGIVAVGASSFFQGGVHHRFVETYLVRFVAGIAHLIPGILKEQLGDYAVPQMATLALFLLDRIVHIFHPQVGIGKLGVTVETVLAGEGSSAGRGGAGCEVNDHAQEKQYSSCKEYTTSRKESHFASHYGFVLPSVFCVIGQLHDLYGMME
ncbi:MAG: hypothetical protein P8017_11220 [Deltaproteobacteria bacterium]